ncbi:putative late blight resistance protein homolog R1A-3 [Solanum pennellii]|uniref:Late blight resistance protein homolog R1A-3 n=1 Tax=Solanum pennellii TaxID=28526 RepID=A0ABM1GU23_SOLPN|nr:putative late blight resistance protein homolog R1A-3 [Solanum pennellii]
MERGKENEGQTKGEDNKSLQVSSALLREDIVYLQDFVERLKNEQDQVEELKFLLACLQLCYYISDAEMSCISYLVQSLLHQSSGDDMMVKLTDHVVPRLLENITSSKISDHLHSAAMNKDQLDELLDVLLVNLHNIPKVRVELISPSMTQYELLQNVFGNLRDFHALKVNGCVEYETIEYVLPQFQLTAERVGHFCFVLLSYHLDKTDEVNSMLVHLLLKIIPVSLDVMHICCTNLKGSNSEEVGFFIKQLLEASPDILRESLIHLQEHMLINAVTPSASTYNIHVMIEFLLIILTDGLKAVIRHDKLFVLLARVIQLTKEVFVFFRNLEENMNEASGSNLNLLENIELLKVDLKNDFLKARANSSPLPFPMSDGPLFMTLLLTNLKDLAYSNAYSVSLIKEEIKQVKQDLEIIRSLFGYAEQELHKDLWTRVLDLAHEAQHAINSILARDHGLLQLIFILPDTVEKIKLVKKEVQEKISESSGIIVANAPNKPVERNSSCTVGKIIVGFEEETEWIIRKLTSGPADIDVISIVGMPGLGKTTLAYRVYNHKSIVDHFDVCAWCTVDQERNEKKLLQKIFNQVIGLKERFNEDHDIDDDVADKLRKRLCGKRYLIVLDDMWDTDTLDELMRPFPEFHKGSRVILTSRKKEVALHGKCHSDPLYLRLLRSEESWELLEKRVFGEEGCPDELKDVGEKIARRCGGLPLVVDLIGGVISKKEKKEALWAEVLNDLSSSIFKDEEEVVKVIQLSYDHLSEHVKPCFVYLASFLKDEDISMSKLNDLWISQGLEMKSAEEVVDELISSSLVIPFNNFIFKIHDLVHDFCDIKCRKEKLLHFIRGSKAPSSSDLMTRGIIVHYNHYVYPLDEYFTVFDPEQNIPYVKHLLNLKDFGMYVRLSYKSHLKHFRLLKSLDLCGITLPESLLNEIGMLVHLKYLKIWMKAKVLPPSFSNLCNLETLMVINGNQSCMILSPCFWSLAKLRVVKMNLDAVFDPVITVLENLTTLHDLYLPGFEDTEDIFKRFPNLKNLQVCIREHIPEKIRFPRFDVLNELEQLSFSVSFRNSFAEYTHGFPLSLKILKLEEFAVTSDTLSRLPNLEELSLEQVIIGEGKEWNMEDHVVFQNLKSLKLSWLKFSKWNMEDHIIFQDLKYLELKYLNFSEWKVDAEKSFPVLEELFISGCDKLMEIPDSFGDIASLKFINVRYSPQLKESLFKIKEYVEEMTGEDKLDVEFYHWGS